MLQQLRPLSPKGLQPDGGVPDSSLSADSVPPLSPPAVPSLKGSISQQLPFICSPSLANAIPHSPEDFNATVSSFKVIDQIFANIFLSM